MDELVVFAKHWRPGTVKTRLASSIGHSLASAVYRSLLETTLWRFSSVADRRRVAFTPREALDEFTAMSGAAAWELGSQCAGDLGTRIHHEIKGRLRRADAVVVMGADSPNVPRAYVERAFALLRHVDAVLGPTDDGGYYLLGLRQDRPGLFNGIAWGTDRVLGETLDRLQHAEPAARYELLPAWYDIDDVSDLARLRSDLEATTQDPFLRALREQLQRTLG